MTKAAWKEEFEMAFFTRIGDWQTTRIGDLADLEGVLCLPIVVCEQLIGSHWDGRLQAPLNTYGPKRKLKKRLQMRIELRVHV